MCLDPVTASLLSFGLGAVQTVSQYAGQRTMAKETERAAIQDMKNKNTAISVRQAQEADALSERKQQLAIEEAELAADTSVSAAAGNVSGISVDNLLADVRRRASRNRNTAMRNTQNTIQQLQMERRGVAAEAQSRINSNPPPSPLSLVAGIGGAALDSYGRYNKYIQ